MKRRAWSAAVAVALIILWSGNAARAQDQAPQQGARRGQLAGMQRIGGTITTISGLNLTVKTADGAEYQVVTTDNTRVMRGRGEAIKLADLKPGDGLMAMGNLDTPNKTMHAAVVISVDAEQVKQMEAAQKARLADLGKTLIAGRVTAIDLDNVTMTVERPDGVSQTIGFDEGTSFKRGRASTGSGNGMGFGRGTNAAGNEPTVTTSSESITLADIKVGDRVEGPGQVKNGKFVPTELTVMTPGVGRRGPQGAGAPASEGSPKDSAQSSSAPK